MATPTQTPARVPLRPGALISQGLGMLLRHFFPFLVISTTLMLPSMIVSTASVAPGFGGGGLAGLVFGPATGIGGGAQLLAAALAGIGSLAAIGAITGITLNLQAGHPARATRAILRGLAAVPLVLVFGAVLFLVLGAILFAMVGAVGFLGSSTSGTVPAGITLVMLLGWLPLSLYVMARYALLVPVIVAERPGLGALGRASALTKGYRWPVAGGLVLMAMLLMLLNLVYAVGFGALFYLDPQLTFTGSSAGILAFSLIGLVTSALAYAVLAIFVALLYARLREIKEGPRAEDLVAVFE